MNLVNPDLLVSAHDHSGYLFTAARATGRGVGPVSRMGRGAGPVALQTRVGEEEVGRGGLADKVWELVIPTTSYRNGVANMGLGLLEVGPGGAVKYNTLWLPARFPLLYTYLASLVLATTILVLGKMAEWVRVRGRRDPLPR